MIEPALRQLIVRWIRRVVAPHATAITVVSLLLTVASTWVVLTEWNINSDFRALLPQDSQATRALEAVEARLGASTAMFAVVSSPDGDANKRFAADFAERLRAMDEVVLAHFHNDKAFFERHQLLYLEAEDLQTLRKRIAEAIRESKKRANPLFVSLDDDAPNPTVETEDLERKYAEDFNRYKEYLVSDDGQSLTIVVRFTEAATDLEATSELLRRIKRTARQLEPTSYHPAMAIDYSGGLVSRQHGYESIARDIENAAGGELFVLLAVIALFFRRLRAVALVFVPLLMGVIWSVAFGFLAFGELTTVSAFIFAILLGLGIDFTLHILNSFDRHRMEGQAPVDALVSCYLSTGRATIVGGVTTFATFMVLAFANFRGISQFGQLSAVGIVLTLVTMLATLPALILLFQRIWPHEPTPLERRRFAPGRWIRERVPTRYVWWGLVVAAVVLTGSAAMFAGQVEFEENFNAIGEVDWPWEKDRVVSRLEATGEGRQTRAQARAVAAGVYRSAVERRRLIAPETYVETVQPMSTRERYESALQGQMSSVPTVLVFDDAEDARRSFRAIESLFDEGRLDAFASVSSIYSFLPGSLAQQQARLVEIEKIAELLEREDLSGVKKKLRERIDELRQKLDVRPVTIRDLPEWTRKLFQEAGRDAKPPADGEDFAYEYLVYMVPDVDQLNGPQARRLVEQLALVREHVTGDVDIAADSEAYVALIDEIQTRGIRLVLIGIGVVFLVLLVSFRHPGRALISISSLAFASLLLLGIIGALGIRFDVFNVVFLTAIVGISVDDDVHLYRRYLDLGRGSIGRAVSWVGPAVAMNTLTSGIGFGGLAITQNAGLQSIGHLAIVGVVCSLLSTLIMLPLVIKVAELFDIPGVVPD